MGRIFEVLEHLSPVQDPEVLDGYHRYESALASVLTPEQMQIYADHIRQEHEIRIFEDMTTSELAALPPQLQLVASEIIADTNLTMENRRVVALLHQHGEQKATPDFQAK